MPLPVNLLANSTMPIALYNSKQLYAMEQAWFTDGHDSFGLMKQAAWQMAQYIAALYEQKSLNIHASDNINLVKASEKLTKHLEDVANKINIPIKKGTVITSAVFDLYIDKTTYVNPYPKEINEFAIAVEMEAFILYYLAFKLNKEASCVAKLLMNIAADMYFAETRIADIRQKITPTPLLFILDPRFL